MSAFVYKDKSYDRDQRFPAQFSTRDSPSVSLSLRIF